MKELPPEEPALDYLKPEFIFAYGIDHADEPPAEMINYLRYRLGYQRRASVRKFKRNPDKQQKGTGEPNPIHRYETVFHIFRRRCLTAAILMAERFHYICEVYMHDESSRDEQQPFNQNEAVVELSRLLAKMQEANLKGEDITTHLAEIKAASQTHLRRQTNTKAAEVREARETANLQLRTAPVNWRVGDPKAFR